MAKLVAYARVSTDPQRENTSLSWQRERIEAYCKFAGHELVSFVEEVESASGKTRRPLLDAALKKAQSAEADGFICAKLDRLAPNTKQGLDIATDLRQGGKQLVIVDLNLDTSTPIGQCIYTVLLSFAQLERDTIVERIMAGKEKVRSLPASSDRPGVQYLWLPHH